MGKNMLLYDKMETPDQVYARIGALTAGNLLGVANDIFQKDQLSKLVYSQK